MQNSKEQPGISRGISESNDPEILTLNKDGYSNPEDNGALIKQIEGLPFAAVKRQDGFVIVFGNNMISPIVYNSFEEAEEDIKKINWIPILNVMGIYVNYALTSNKQNNE